MFTNINCNNGISVILFNKYIFGIANNDLTVTPTQLHGKFILTYVHYMSEYDIMFIIKKWIYFIFRF